MASSKDRQRALARAKAERQFARRALAARKRRRWQAASTAILTVAVVGVGGVWMAGGFDADPEDPDVCAWTAASSDTNTDLQEVGTPETKGIPESGTKTMTINFTQGTVEVQMDLAETPCSAASLSFLAGQNFFDNTTCHRLVSGSFYALQCGDPKATGLGGPTYTSIDENLPLADETDSASASATATESVEASASVDPSASSTTSGDTYSYSKGIVAFSNNGPNTNGSQFYIFYADSPSISSEFSIIGTVTSGIDVVEGIAAVGIADVDGVAQTDGAPKETVTISTLTVSDVIEESTSESAVASTDASTDPSASTVDTSATPAVSTSS